MAGESPETQIARLDERLSTILLELRDAKDGRKHQYEKLEEFGRSLVSIEARVVNVEEGLNKASPTIDEFLVIKHKVVGAGIVGKWLWAILGSLAGMAFAMRSTIIEWISK